MRNLKSHYKHIIYIIFILFGFLNLGCQSSPLKDFSELKNGMDKGEVLDILGSPNYSGRFHGKDRWIYTFYDNKIRYKKEVHFEDGQIVYVGDEWAPPETLSAKVIDEKNESVEKVAIQQEEERLKKNKESSFSDYEANVKGEVKVIPMPNYVPIE